MKGFDEKSEPIWGLSTIFYSTENNRTVYSGWEEEREERRESKMFEHTGFYLWRCSGQWSLSLSLSCSISFSFFPPCLEKNITNKYIPFPMTMSCYHYGLRICLASCQYGNHQGQHRPLSANMLPWMKGFHSRPCNFLCTSSLFSLYLSSVLAWRSPGTGEPGGLPSMGSHRVGHDWSDLAAAAADIWFLLKNKLNYNCCWANNRYLRGQCQQHVFLRGLGRGMVLLI